MSKIHPRTIRTEPHGWTAHSHDLLKMLGYAKPPVTGAAPVLIQGVQVYVKPLGPLPPDRKMTGHGYWQRRQGHRVMAICPDCSQHMSAGRLHQHRCP